MLSKSLLVFPTSRAIRDYISHDSSNRLLSPILSISELFKKAVTIGEFKYCDDEQRFLYLKEATENTKLENLGISNTFNAFIKQSEYIFRFFCELSAEEIQFENISSADTYDFYEEHLNILENIYNNYCNLLEKNYYVDKITLPKKYKTNETYIKKFKDITLFYEGYFTNFEFRLIKEIANITTLKIELKTNKYNKKSYEKFEDIGFILKIDHHYVLDISNQKILKEEKINKKKQKVDIKAFSLRANQTSFVRHSVVNMINDGLKPNEIVVIVPNESFAKTIELFDEDKYFNYAMGKSIQKTHLYTNANSIFNYLNSNEQKYIDYIKFLKLDITFIDEVFKKIWHKNITREGFNTFVNFLKHNERDEEILEKYEELIYTIEKTIFNYIGEIKFSEFAKFLIQKIDTITLDDVNGYAVSVMGLLETRGIKFKGVIVVDFNEEYVPKRSIKDKFLSMQVKTHSKLPIKEDRENLQKYYYNHLFENASHLAISYVQNSTSTISRFANELFGQNFSKIPSDYLYENMIFSKRDFEPFNKDIISDFEPSKYIWSATSLKVYLDCKRNFYLKYIAKISDHHFSVKPQGFEIGNIIHTILEEFYKNNSSLNQSTQSNILNNYFENIKEPNPFLIIELELWKKRFEEFIENEKNEFELKRKKIFKIEHKFEIKHKGITLKGVIDRVDKGEDFFEIIDYKTSSSIKIDSLKTYEKSTDFQLEFYYLAMSEFAQKNSYKNFKIIPYYYDLKNSKLLEELCIDEKLENLENIFEEFKNIKSVDFAMTQNKSTCQFCAYKSICNK